MDPRTKVVVRKLPPSVAEADVRQLVDAVAGGQYTWFAFVQGKTSVKKLVHSRCYVNFAEPGAIPAFKGAIEAHAFVTERGAQYRGCVEYAPFQKIPDARVKRDPREGTLESDSDYQAFLERLNEEPPALPSSAGASVPITAAGAAGAKSGEVVTPLMAYLREKHAQQQQRGGKGSSGGAAQRPPKADVAKNDKKRGSSRSKGVAKDESSDYDRRMPTAVLTNKNRASREDAPAHPAAKPAAASNSSGSSRPPRAPKQGPSSSPKQSPRVERSGSAVAPDQAAVLDKAVPSRGSSEERPERVRAGFGLYQPKRRGRLSGDEPDPAASEDSAAVAGPGSKNGQAAVAGGASQEEKQACTSGQGRRRPPREARKNSLAKNGAAG